MTHGQKNIKFLPRIVCRTFLSCRSAAARLLRMWVRIPPGAWMSVSYECCVLSGRGLCDELFTRPEESHRLWRVVVCDLETSWMRRPWPNGGGAGGLSRQKHIFLSTQTPCNTSSFLTLSAQHNFSILLHSHISKLSMYFWSTVPIVQVSALFIATLQM